MGALLNDDSGGVVAIIKLHLTQDKGIFLGTVTGISILALVMDLFKFIWQCKILDSPRTPPPFTVLALDQDIEQNTV